MAGKQEYEKVYIASIILAVVILVVNLYYYCHPLFREFGVTLAPADYIMQVLRHGGIFSTPLKTKGAVLLLLLLSTVVRTGKGADVDKAVLCTVGIIGIVLYMLPYFGPLVYLFTTLTGVAALVWTFAMLSRLFFAFHAHDNDLRESFEQESEPIAGDWAINLPTKYYWHKQWHDGVIPVGNPFRGTLIVGSAGSGKSFSVFNPYIEQMIANGYTMMLYDFKMPDLTKVVYNALDRNKGRYKKTPQFYCINFKDPMRSNRCNPLDPEYLEDIIDASETARVVMEALNKGNEKKDFFWMSAQQYIGICIWLLRIYTPPGGCRGDWCDFPHVIELINQDYTKVLDIVKRQPTLDGKARVFIDALEANAQDQLQGQIASARIPLNDIASPILYWVLSGNDFSLDINDPEDPKVLCIGNDPDRQQVYGAALSLFTFRVIKRVNQPGRLPCALMMDELPTISVQGLANLMATARSNKVAVVLGVQDISQITADYGEKEAEKIIALPANVFVGSSSVKTAEKYNKEFGKEFRRQESQTRNMDSDSVNISYHEEEIMPIRKITSLPQGTFIGKVAVDNGSQVQQPFFCASIQIDMEEYRRKKASEKEIPALTDFEQEGLWNEVSIPEIGCEYIAAALEKTIRKEWRLHLKLRFSKEELDAEVSRRLDAMTDQQCRDMLEELMPQIRRQDINRIMEDNYYVIKGDIRQLIELESENNEGEEEEEYVAQEKTADEEPQKKAPSKAKDERKEPEMNTGDNNMKQILQREIESLSLTARTRTALVAAGILTLGELAVMSRSEVSHIKLIGRHAVAEIETLLKTYSLDWESDLSRYGFAKKETQS